MNLELEFEGTLIRLSKPFRQARIAEVNSLEVLLHYEEEKFNSVEELKLFT